MSKHHLAFEQTVLRPRAEVFQFFARPENLARITPRAMDFVLESVDTEMREGLRISYRLRPLLGIRVSWVSRIPRYDPPHAFIDVQEQGPYASWTHTHRFEEVTVAGVAATRVIDEIEYELPFGAIGDLVDMFVVRRKLRTLFVHRRRAIERLLATPVVPATDSLKVAVAGGSGFVGGAIAAELRQRGEDVTVLSHRVAHAADGLPVGMELKWADIADPASLQRALAGADALVISLAFPNSPMESPRRGHTFEAVDARGTALLVDAAVAAGVARLVYISGAGADAGSPRSWFRAKAHAEEAVRRSGIPYTIIRPTWIYGPRDISLNRFLAFGRWLPFIPLTGTGWQRLAPVFIDDVARLAADSLRAEAARDQVFEIGGPETMSMREVIRTALRASGVGRPLLPAPAVVLKLVAWPLRHLPRPPLTPDGVDFINQPAHVDLRPLLARMPRQLTPLATGLATYLDEPRERRSGQGGAMIDAGRARDLARWNASLSALHFSQFLLMIAVSRTAVLFTATISYVVPRLANGAFAGFESRTAEVVAVPLAYVVASFLLLSAIAHFLLRWPLRERYERWLARGMNPARWVEYAFSSTIMILAVAQLSFIKEFSALIAIAGCNVAMILFGWSMEAANEGRVRVDWKPFVFGCIIGIVPWLAIGAGLVTYASQADALPIPAFVWAIYGSLFVAFNIFALTMVLQYARIGRWRDYLVGEKTYMVMSLVAKSLLAWQVWSGTLRPM